ncbi:MAG: CDP-alcohol phosphatidyltransferase family protein [Anaerolineae bacterium]|jgi:CDP-diacylglycerol--glycerol-3-phosphate 3-phosphatidyltransferase|nr:CDP-alcohol phosphatidyltransferase family protein [Anaerolineae bacterium]MDH7475175.1 CDP-alcohol phosphatidyltransferase family protein [Anaerolineae bacterium]
MVEKPAESNSNTSATPPTLTDYARKWGRYIVEPMARALARLGIPPNVVTVSGFVLNIGVGIVLALGHIRWGGVCIILAAIFDALDGTLARIVGRTSRFGAFLDSTMDRFSEAVIFLGLLVWYTRLGARQEILLIYATIVGSQMVSYTRARAEGLGLSCKVGILTRMERVIVLTAGLLLNQVLIALWIMAILTNLTALQRMIHVWQATRKEERELSEQIAPEQKPL